MCFRKKVDVFTESESRKTTPRLRVGFLAGKSLAGDCMFHYMNDCTQIEVVARSGHLNTLRESVSRSPLDLVVAMGDAGLSELVARMVVKQQVWSRGVPVVIVGDDSTPREVRVNVAAGLAGFIDLSWGHRRLLDALFAAARGGSVSTRVKSSALTEAERTTACQLASGATSKELASDLNVSSRTIDARRRRVQEKLGLDSVASITKFCIGEGLVELDGA